MGRNCKMKPYDLSTYIYGNGYFGTPHNQTSTGQTASKSKTVGRRLGKKARRARDKATLRKRVMEE